MISNVWLESICVNNTYFVTFNPAAYIAYLILENPQCGSGLIYKSAVCKQQTYFGWVIVGYSARRFVLYLPVFVMRAVSKMKANKKFIHDSIVPYDFCLSSTILGYFL
jgi:hypothetical protein